MARAPIDSNHHKGLIIRDGIGGVELDVTGESLTNAHAMHVAIVDGSGNQITTFGGSGGTSATDDGAFTAGSGLGTPMMGLVTSDSVDSGDVGVIGMLANRQQKMTLYDSSGVEITSFGATNAGTFAVQESGAALTALQLIDDAIVADDAAFTPATTKVMMVGATYDNTSPDSVNEGDAGAMRMSADRILYTIPRSTTPTQTTVASSATSVTVLAANVDRKGATITNDSSAILYLKLGATASTTSYTVTLAGAAAAPFAYYEVPFGYSGVIDGIWASATGNARITEIT